MRLRHEIEMPHDLPGGRRGGGHQVMPLRQTGGGAVIHHHPVLAQHQPIAHPPRPQGREGVGIDEVEEAARIGALNVDLAKGGDIADANPVADKAHLAVAGVKPALVAGTREIGRAVPQPRLHHRRAAFDAGLMRGGEALRREALALPARAKGRDGDRDIGRAEGGDPGLRYAAPGGVSQNRQRRHVGVLALIGGHALRRVALHVLDGAVVLLRRQTHILGRYVIGEIEPGAMLAPRHLPEGAQAVCAILGLRQIDGLRPAAKFGKCGFCRLQPLAKAGLGRKCAIRGTCHRQPRHHARLRNERCDLLAPDRAAVHVAGNVQRRVPAAGDGEAVAGDAGDLARTVGDHHLAQALPADGIDHLRPGMKGRAIRGGRILSHVDEG